MHFTQTVLAVFLATLLPAFTVADALEDSSNGTVSYMKVERSDLTRAELAAFYELDKEVSVKLAKRGIKRETCTTSSYKRSVLVGNGSPHQNYYYQQVRGVENCNGPSSGSTSYDTSVSVGWSASIGGAYSWLSGGFSVSESYSSGGSFSMSCQAHDKEICIYEKIAYTAYTVQPQNCVYNTCWGLKCSNTGGHVIFFSPNSNQWGGCFYKGVSPKVGCGNEISGCYGQGTGFWRKCGQAGGPPNHIVCDPFESRTCGQTCHP